MFWNGKYTGEIVTIKGEMCAPIKPIINLNPSQDMSIFEFEKSTVLYIGEVLEKAPAEKDDLDSHFNLKCKLCNRMIKPIEMRTHIGAHILKDNLKYKCGFCGGPNANCDNKLIPTNKKKVFSIIKCHLIVIIRCYIKESQTHIQQEKNVSIMYYYVHSAHLFNGNILFQSTFKIATMNMVYQMSLQ